MKMKTGIWIDTKKAVIVFLDEDSHTVKTVDSLIESRERIRGESKWFTRFGSQFLNFETKKKNRRSNEIREYLKKVANEIKDTDELVLFGPAIMKTELEKIIRNEAKQPLVIKGVETADSMTENQMIAWVKQYYQKKPAPYR